MGQFSVEKTDAGTFLMYRYEKAEEDSLTRKMMLGNRIPGLLPAELFETAFGGIVRYDIRSRIALSEMFSEEQPFIRVSEILRRMAEAVRSAEDYMIKPENLVFDPGRIYTDDSSGAAEMVCLPVFRRNQGKTDLRLFFRELLYRFRYAAEPDRREAARLIGQLSAGKNFSSSELCGLLKQPEEPERAYMIRTRSGEKIPIGETISRIGRESSAEVLIEGNPAISRRHAVIGFLEGRFYFTDCGSTNHSYTDGRMIPPDTPLQIRSGSRIRLADEEFVFMIRSEKP